MTEEQKYINRINREKAREHFGLVGKWDLVMHHIDPSWRYEDVERYILWNPEDLVIVSRAEHNTIHKTGVIKSEETRRKISVGNTGKVRSEEEKKRISEKLKGRPSPNKGNHNPRPPKSEESKRKMSENRRGKGVGKHWFNNGEKSILSYECPDGYVKGRI